MAALLKWWMVILLISISPNKGQVKNEEEEQQLQLQLQQQHGDVRRIIGYIQTHMETTELHFQKLYFNFEDLRDKFQFLNETQNEILRRVDDVSTRVESLEEVASEEAIVNQTCRASQFTSLQDTILTELEAVKESTEELKRESSRIETDLKRFIETQTTTIQTELEAVKQSTSELTRESSRIETDFRRSIETQATTIRAGIQSVMATTQQCSSNEQLIERIKQLSSKDECQDGSNNCSPNATCQDRIVGYKCQCLQGYSGDGVTCTVPPCLPPSAVIDGLGCVTPFKITRRWFSARDHCKAEGAGSRLLEGITSQQEMDLLKEKFDDYFDGYSRYTTLWIGMKAKPWQWEESGDSIDPSSSPASSALWQKGQPNDGSSACGTICLGCLRPSLVDHPCSRTRYFLCQRK